MTVTGVRLAVMPAMSWFDRLRSVLRGEAAEVRESVEDLTRRADAELDRRERELQATPEERLDATRREIEEAGDPFAEVRAKLDAMRHPSPGEQPPGRAPPS